MKAFKELLLSSLCVMFMTACNEVPEDVRSRTEQSRELSEKHTGEIKYIPVDEMKDDIEKAFNDTYSNFKLRKGIEVRLPERFTECEFTQTEGFLSNTEKALDTFFDENEIEGIELQNGRFPEDGKKGSLIKAFRDDDKELHFCDWDNGFLCVMRGELFTQMTLGGKTVKIYHVDRGEDLSDKYLLGDKEYSVKEAVDAAQEFIDDKYAQFDPGYELKVKTVKVMQNDLGEYSMYHTVIKLYNGVKLDDMMLNLFSNTENDDSDFKPKRFSKVLLGCKSGIDIEYLTNNDGTVKAKEIKTLDKAVSLSSALQYIEKRFTDFNSIPEICDIQLSYTLSPVYDEDTSIYNAPGTKMESRLVWEMIISLSEDEEKSLSRIKPEHGDVRKYIRIDAETGEMEFEFDVNMLLQE